MDFQPAVFLLVLVSGYERLVSSQKGGAFVGQT
jgi:hypothetical protein